MRTLIIAFVLIGGALVAEAARPTIVVAPTEVPLVVAEEQTVEIPAVVSQQKVVVQPRVVVQQPTIVHPQPWATYYYPAYRVAPRVLPPRAFVHWRYW